MVEDYLSDREQEEALRNWWRDNWRWVIAGVALGLVALGGWKFWQQHERAEAESAAQAFNDFTTALATGAKDKVEQTTKELESKYKDSPYANQAHLALAQSKVRSGQFDEAASELKYVVDHSKDVALTQIAKLRLARVQLQLGHPDEALVLLDITKAGAFISQVQEVRGDALLAKGDRSGARLAYQAALDAAANSDPTQASPDFDGALLRLKLQDLGEEPAPEPTAAQATPAAK